MAYDGESLKVVGTRQPGEVFGEVPINEVTASAAAPAASSLATGFTASITGLQGGLAYAVELLGTWSASNALNTTTLNQMFLVGLN